MFLLCILSNSLLRRWWSLHSSFCMLEASSATPLFSCMLSQHTAPLHLVSLPHARCPVASVRRPASAPAVGLAAPRRGTPPAPATPTTAAAAAMAPAVTVLRSAALPPTAAPACPFALAHLPPTSRQAVSCTEKRVRVRDREGVPHRADVRVVDASSASQLRVCLAVWRLTSARRVRIQVARAVGGLLVKLHLLLQIRVRVTVSLLPQMLQARYLMWHCPAPELRALQWRPACRAWGS